MNPEYRTMSLADLQAEKIRLQAVGEKDAFSPAARALRECLLWISQREAEARAAEAVPQDAQPDANPAGE